MINQSTYKIFSRAQKFPNEENDLRQPYELWSFGFIIISFKAR